MEDPAKYSSARNARVSARTASDPDFIGAEAALKRASTKAIERARRARRACAGSWMEDCGSRMSSSSPKP